MMYWILKGILKPPLLGIYRIRPEGLENVPKKGAAIIAANHLSFLDSFFIPLVVPWRKVTYLAKADYFKSWKTSWFFKAAGQISCEREGGAKSEQSLNIALDVLKSGNLLGIYPEGTRSPDGKLYKGRTGVARLALKAGVPVIPTGLVGTEAVMPKEAKLPKIRGQIKVNVRFGKPLDFSRYAGQEQDRYVAPLRHRRDRERDHAAVGSGVRQRVRIAQGHACRCPKPLVRWKKRSTSPRRYWRVSRAQPSSWIAPPLSATRRRACPLRHGTWPARRWRRRAIRHRPPWPTTTLPRRARRGKRPPAPSSPGGPGGRPVRPSWSAWN